MIYIILAVIFVGALAYFAIWRRKKNNTDQIVSNLPVKLPSQWLFTYDRPNTPFIQSVAAVPDAAIEKIIAGIQKQIETTPREWNISRSVSDYNVAFIDPDRLNIDGSPALIIHGIQSAGTCIGVGNDGQNPPVIVLPHQEAQGWQFLDYLKASARNESEHFAEWQNSQSEFYRFLGAGDIHPHYPDVNGN